MDPGPINVFFHLSLSLLNTSKQTLLATAGPKLATRLNWPQKNSARISRAPAKYMSHTLHDDTNPPDLDQERLILADPWPQLPNQPSGHGSNLANNAPARRHAPCREFICIVQVTETTMFELVRFLKFKPVLRTAFRGVSCAARDGVAAF